MDILGIGFPELVVIFIIALMVFGPRRLPELAGKAGKFVRDLRNMSQGLLTEWQREITVAARVEELEEARRELEQTKKELRELRSIAPKEALSSVEELKEAGRELEETNKELQEIPQQSAPEETLSSAEPIIAPAPSPSKATPPSTSPQEVLNE